MQCSLGIAKSMDLRLAKLCVRLVQLIPFDTPIVLHYMRYVSLNF